MHVILPLLRKTLFNRSLCLALVSYEYCVSNVVLTFNIKHKEIKFNANHASILAASFLIWAMV